MRRSRMEHCAEVLISSQSNFRGRLEGVNKDRKVDCRTPLEGTKSEKRTKLTPTLQKLADRYFDLRSAVGRAMI